MACSKYYSSEKEGQDDISYTTVEVPVESYPRIKHFQCELQDLYSRFKNIYETLPESLKLSAEKSCSLKDAVHQLTYSSPVIFMFGSTNSKIPTRDLVKKFGQQHIIQIHQLGDIHHLGDTEKKYKLVVALCTLQMMDTKKGRDTLQKVMDIFGQENMMFFVDTENELNRELVVNKISCLKDLLAQKKEDIQVIYESKTEMIANDISNHIEHKFVRAFQSFNMFLLEITKKRSRPSGSTFGDEGTGGRMYRAIKEHFRNPLTVIDLLVTSKGESAEEKLATAVVTFTKTVIIKEIAKTYELEDAKVFDYWQKENYNDNWIRILKKHLRKVPLVTKLYHFIKKPEDNSVKSDLQKHYSLDDAKIIGKEVTKVLMGQFLQVGTSVKKISLSLGLLTQLRKELMRLLEETIKGDKYDKDISKLKEWRKQIEWIKEIEAVGIVFGKLLVLLNSQVSAEREIEIRTQIRRSLRSYPGEVVVQFGSHTFFSGRDGSENNSEIFIGDAFISENGNRGTIGLFMQEDGTESKDLHFVTSSSALLGSNVVKTNDEGAVLGTRRHSLMTEDGLIDIAAIRIEEKIKHRCNVFFQDNYETCECKILDLDAIGGLKEGKHVYKRGSTTRETKGCIISEDFRKAGVNTHNFLVGLPIGVDAATLQKGFAKEGDSGAVLYIKTPDGEVQYLAILMGEFSLRDKQEGENLNSTFIKLTNQTGSLILATCLREGLDKIENTFKFKLSLPTI